MTALHPVAELYGRWALNPLVDLAHSISFDFVARPQQYRDVSEEVADVLTDFRFKVGIDSDWPDSRQRTLNFKALYQVCLASSPMRHAAMVAVEATPSASQRALVATYDATAKSFRDQMASIDGRSLRVNCGQTERIFDAAVAVFRDPGVANAFGLGPAPAEGWPLGGQFSGAGAQLVASAATALKRATCSGGWFRRTSGPWEPLFREFTVALSADKFVALQRAAHFGAVAISAALSDHSDGKDTDAVEFAYQWSKALQPLVPDVERAWKDVAYRAHLSDLEWGLAPNPAGNATVSSAGALAAQTCTVGCEVCCCSGDLDCDPTVVITDFCTDPLVCTLV